MDISVDRFDRSRYNPAAGTAVGVKRRSKVRSSVGARRGEILPLLGGARPVKVSDLAAQLGVSAVTLRRDLRALEDEGLIKRTHGGAVLLFESGEELPYDLAREVRKEQKEWIAQAASALVGHGDSIIVDAGTTTASFVRALRGKRDLKVVTNSLWVVEAAAREDWTVLCPGGVVRNKSLAFVGPVAEKGLANLRVGTMFLAFNALCRDGWFYSLDSFSVSMKQAMLACASRVVALGDSSKIMKEGLIRLAPLSAVDILVTDEEAAETDLAAVVEHGVIVLIAGPGRVRRLEPAKARSGLLAQARI
jgi:DeoR/GlpR family transcriptional regulator of sugar metabolism